MNLLANMDSIEPLSLEPPARYKPWEPLATFEESVDSEVFSPPPLRFEASSDRNRVAKTRHRECRVDCDFKRFWKLVANVCDGVELYNLISCV